ncbi:hypothetical protein GH714_001714 [Hevea brasiliensis]|uniref:Uncharacterized protein n=1 Tax=Hevea brasiliensis TaxID=3981 RepID=A0A6A6LX33_HEVBR|nr:hypothetical protein GH714_001714 [Hevea brasiliensis]
MKNTHTRYCKGVDLEWLELSPDEHEIEADDGSTTRSPDLQRAAPPGTSIKLSCDGNKKRKASKSESMCNNSESQVGSERFTVRRNHFYAIVHEVLKERKDMLNGEEEINERKRTIPPKVVGSRGYGVNHGRGAYRIRLLSVSQPHRNPVVPPPTPKEVADHELHKCGDEHDLSAFVAQIVIADIRAKPTDPWEVVDRDRRLEAYEFEGSSIADIA